MDSQQWDEIKRRKTKVQIKTPAYQWCEINHKHNHTRSCVNHRLTGSSLCYIPPRHHPVLKDSVRINPGHPDTRSDMHRLVSMNVPFITIL